ncbi:MAG: transaldolase [Pseudomonadota bacterium]
MKSNPLTRVCELGQSLWLDYIQRDMLENGELQRLIRDDGISGITSNPAILAKAIGDHHEYDDAIAEAVRHGTGAPALYEALVLADVQAAADCFRQVYEHSGARDGYVSLEVSPHLAHDTAGTIGEARRLWQLFGRDNAMIKVPATRAGIPAIATLVADGININATLLFSLPRYREVADAYLQGLEWRLDGGLPIDRIASVASFFLSRIDVLIDADLDRRLAQDPELGRHDAALRGQVAVACAKLAYQDFKQLFQDARWRRLAQRGGRPQRLLWASTSTKDPAYSDVKYVDALIGADTVNTLPPETLAAYRDHGQPAARLESDVAAARDILQRLPAAGIDLTAAAKRLEQEGVDKFIKPYDQLLALLGQRTTNPGA